MFHFLELQNGPRNPLREARLGFPSLRVHTKAYHIAVDAKSLGGIDGVFEELNVKKNVLNLANLS